MLNPGHKAQGAIVAAAAVLALSVGCNAEPTEEDYANLGQVGYRDGDDGPNSGERGCMKMSEVLWTGSLSNEMEWRQNDIFIEFRNECMRPINMTGWILELSGADNAAWKIPGPPEGQPTRILDVGEHAYAAATDEFCFNDPDWIIPGLRLPYGDAFRLTLRDADERLQEPVGDRYQPPFAGGYDLVTVRSMERLEIMFGGRGNEPTSWHFYTDAPVDVPNNDRVNPDCRTRTLASPGRANSPDYSGAFASGSFE